MADHELKLNTLGRYGKNQTHLILEQHSHCEVPAGCGGAVLRWRSPGSGLLFLFRLYVAGTCELFLDGVTPQSGRPLIGFGPHALALKLTEFNPDEVLLALALIHDESEYGFPHVSKLSGRKLAIMSAADGTWKYAITPPHDDLWMSASFDDSAWSPMISRNKPALPAEDMRSYHLNAAIKPGAACLGIPSAASTVWIRKSFEVSPIPD